MDSQLMKYGRGGMRLVASLLFISLLAACSSGGSSTTATKSPTKIALATLTSTHTPSPTATPSSSPITWPAFDGGGSRSGVNASETIITRDNVGKLTRLWQKTLPDIVDSSPVELPNVHTSAGVKTLLFVTTLRGSLLAIDAATGNLVWRRDTFGPKITNSSPAIDPSGQFVYSYGLDGKVHKYAVGSGNESIGGGWPAIVTLMTIDEKESSALNISNSYLYVTTSGYLGDGGHYEGHVVAIKLSTGVKMVFNSLCTNIHQLMNNIPGDANYCPDTLSGIWARAGVVIDPVTQYVFITTGNGPYNANTGGHDYGDTVIELTPDLMKVIDTFTPTNYPKLQAGDLDLGSAAPVMLPEQIGSSTPYMAAQAGKDNTVYLLNRENLSSMGGPDHVGGEIQAAHLPQRCSVPTHPVAWNDSHNVTWLFVANDCGLTAYTVVTDANGHSSLQVAYTLLSPGSSPFIADSILFLQSPGILQAMEPTTGKVLWSSSQPSAGGKIGELHWQSPIVVNGYVYVPDEAGQLTAYGLAHR